MNLVNEKVEHISHGFGIVTEQADNKILVQFQEDIGNKTFLYTYGFKKFLKTVNPNIESNMLEELHEKQEQLELERFEREREAAELKEKRLKETYNRKRGKKVVKQKD